MELLTWQERHEAHIHPSEILHADDSEIAVDTRTLLTYLARLDSTTSMPHARCRLFDVGLVMLR